MSCGERMRISPSVSGGYLDAQDTADQLDGDGWFYPGDLGKISADGWLTFCGRRKDIINRGGEKFSTVDIETALMAYGPILKAAVIGTPDPRLGETVCACIVLREGHSWTDAKPVLEHLEAFGLARPKFPVEWVIVDDFPATATGKVQKQQLLQIALERRASAA